MHPAPQLGMDLPQLRGHPFADRDADDREGARCPAGRTDVGKTEKVEGFRTPSPRVVLRSAAKRPNSIRRVFSGWSSNPNFAMLSVPSTLNSGNSDHRCLNENRFP